MSISTLFDCPADEEDAEVAPEEDTGGLVAADCGANVAATVARRVVAEGAVVAVAGCAVGTVVAVAGRTVGDGTDVGTACGVEAEQATKKNVISTTNNKINRLKRIIITPS